MTIILGIFFIGMCFVLLVSLYSSDGLYIAIPTIGLFMMCLIIYSNPWILAIILILVIAYIFDRTFNAKNIDEDSLADDVNEIDSENQNNIDI